MQKETHAGGNKPERYVQPSILLALLDGSSYGYELLQRLPQFGFLRDDAPPGMIYRHLRQMEDDGLLTSRWETNGTGPAKRIYGLTATGSEVLNAWVCHMEKKIQKLQNFVKLYRDKTSDS